MSNPAQWIPDFAAAGADLFTFHLEAVLAGPVGALGAIGLARRPGVSCRHLTRTGRIPARFAGVRS